KAVYGHFIERPENLQGTAEGVIGINVRACIQWLWWRRDCVLGRRRDGAWMFDSRYRIPSCQDRGTIRPLLLLYGRG
ncbi:MAG TPA: hypothetical protein VE222_06485, partial [Nitrospiraceae bacterium]|nr:hypothetical protein [Nitrospiraceae bacterium]